MQGIRSVSSLISGPAAFFILIAFFLPWITISCSGTELVDASGYEMATGIKVDDEVSSETDSSDTDDSDGYLLIIPIMALLTLVVAGVRLAAVGTSQMAAVVYLVAGAFGLGAHLIEFIQLQSDISDLEETSGEIIELSYKFGWWLSILGLIAVLVAAFVAFREREQRAAPYPPYQQPGSGYYGGPY